MMLRRIKAEYVFLGGLLLVGCKDPKAPLEPESSVLFKGSEDGVKAGEVPPILEEGSIQNPQGQAPGEVKHEGSEGVSNGNNSSGSSPTDSSGGSGSHPSPNPTPAPTPPPPTPPAFYPADCAALKKAQPDAVSGPYKIYLNAESADRVALEAYCDMKEDGGGWTLLLNYVHKGGTNPALKLFKASLPLFGGDTLGSDESAQANVWGHASPGLLAKFAVKELRFYCRSTENARVLHFKTTDANCLKAATTGVGNCISAGSAYTALSSHSATIPGRGNEGLDSSGDLALTDDVFGRAALGANVMWSIKGSNESDAWECDFGSNNDTSSTIHRVFFR